MKAPALNKQPDGDKPRKALPAEPAGKGRSQKAPKPPAEAASESAVPSPKKSKREKREAREAEIEKDLLFELDQLRKFIQHITQHCRELLESEVVQIRDTVSSSRGTPDRLYNLSAMLEALRGLRVKPDKGRLKDLKRIDDMVSLLNRITQRM
jgi:hypothetical protein